MTRIAVAPSEMRRGVHPAGFPAQYCKVPGCAHTYDWRHAPGDKLNLHGITAEHRPMDLAEALARTFTTDAMAVPYLLRRDGVPLDAFPRVSKASLPWLASEGFEVVVGVLLADIDNPAHGPWTPDLWVEFEERYATAQTLATAGVYVGRGGWRVVQPLLVPVAVERAEAVIDAWFEQLEADRILPDNACRDWTRHMRLPGARRDGRRYAAEASVRLERMVPIEGPAPRKRRSSGAPNRTRSKVIDGMPVFRSELPAWWSAARVTPIAKALVRESGTWHDLSLALAGALLQRGVEAADLAAVLVGLFGATGTDARPEDRRKAAASTCARAAGGVGFAGYAALRASWPGVADALDVVTACGVELRVLRQVAAVAEPARPLDEARAQLAAVFEAPYGLTVVSAPPGTGKTTAGVARAMRLPVFVDRAPPGARMAWSVPDHRLGAEVQAAGDPARTARIFSPLAHKTDGAPTCIYYSTARALVNGAQSLEWEFCRGRNRTPCERSTTCPARSGWEGPQNANLVVGPHALLGSLSSLAGTAGTLVVDEPGELVLTEAFTRDDVSTAVRYSDAFTARYRAAIEPALGALVRWARELAVEDEATPIAEAITAGANGNADVVETARGAILPDARSKAPPITSVQIAIARRSPGRAAEIGAASRVLDRLWRSITSTPEPTVRVDATGRITLAYLDEGYAKALRREGPCLVLDANAALRVPAIQKVTGYAPNVVRVNVADRCPVERVVFATTSASRASWFSGGVPEWDSTLPAAIRAAVAWVLERPCASLAVFTWASLELAIQGAMRPDAIEPMAAWVASGLDRGDFERARDNLRPLLAPLVAHGIEVLTGHFWALRGLNSYADCDASLTLGDPRPNLGAERDACDLLGLNSGDRLDARAAAELEQAHGRLRAINREKPARMAHVGAVLPAWPGLPVDVRQIPGGRPRTEGAISGDELRRARVAAGLSQAALAERLGVSKGSIQHYEAGRSAIPSSVAQAALRLS